MNILLQRLYRTKEFTIGALFIDGVFMCFTLEDQKQVNKVSKETRIWAGLYKVAFRTEGGFFSRYLKQFGAAFHKGMLQIMNVPQFEYILIHIGNTDKDTAGCILVGLGIDMATGVLTKSTDAYKKIYPVIEAALSRGEEVIIEIKDEA